MTVIVALGETTVMDIFNELGRTSNVVMVMRHGSYFTGPLVARLLQQGIDPNEVETIAYARNLARMEPDCMFALNSNGIQIARRQGRLLAEAEIKIDEVIGSHQARGPDTGLFITEGYHDVTERWLPFSCHRAIDYPVYDYEAVLRALKAGDEKVMVHQWLNGKRPGLITNETPRSFHGRVTGFITDLLQTHDDGKDYRNYILTTHYEITLLAKSVYVDHAELGRVDQFWEPEKNSGVIIWTEDEHIQACGFNPALKLVI